ncbi:MAG: cupin domain-containing protein [Dongiaceae bacterium]
MMLEKLDILSLGNGLAVDRDHALTDNASGAVVLIRLAPRKSPFPEEKHHTRENIVCLEGRLALLAGVERVEISAGQCCRVPAGLAHRWASDSAGLVLVHFGN